MKDEMEGKHYKDGVIANEVYGSCWRLHDIGDYTKLCEEYKSDVIIKTSILSLRDCFDVFAHTRRSTVAIGFSFPEVIFAKVHYSEKIIEDINLDQMSAELMFSTLCWNYDEDIIPFLFKKMNYEFEQEMRIFTKWKTIKRVGSSYLSDDAIFKKYNGEEKHLSCTNREDILAIEREIIGKEFSSTADLDQLQPIGFFYHIPLDIMEEIYTHNSTLNKVRIFLDNSDHSFLSKRLKTCN